MLPSLYPSPHWHTLTDFFLDISIFRSFFDIFAIFLWFFPLFRFSPILLFFLSIFFRFYAIFRFFDFSLTFRFFDYSLIFRFFPIFRFLSDSYQFLFSIIRFLINACEFFSSEFPLYLHLLNWRGWGWYGENKKEFVE